MLWLYLLLFWLFLFSFCSWCIFDNFVVMVWFDVLKIVRNGGKWLLTLIRVFFINRDWTFYIAMILVQHIINCIFLPFRVFSLRFWLFYVQWIFDTVFVLYQFRRTLTAFNKLNPMKQESSNFKRSQCNSFTKLFVKNTVLILKINNIIPVPFCINELLIMHIVT